MDGVISLLKEYLPVILAKGPTRFAGIFRLSEDYIGHRIDIRLVKPESWPYALLYFTGSQRFDILMRQRAIDLGLKLNEYGLYDNLGQPQYATNEKEIFDILQVAYLEPVERTKTLLNLTYK